MSNWVDNRNMAISAKNAPPTYHSQTFCLQGTANQKKTGLKAEIKQLVFDRGWTEELHQSPIKDKYRGVQPTRFKPSSDSRIFILSTHPDEIRFRSHLFSFWLSNKVFFPHQSIHLLSFIQFRAAGGWPKPIQAATGWEEGYTNLSQS